MKWFIKKHIFDFRSMITMVYDLDKMFINPISQSSKFENSIITRRIVNLNNKDMKRINDALLKIDIKPTFDAHSAKERLNKGFYFIVAQYIDDIVGWCWCGFDKVKYEELNCYLKLKKRYAFYYNAYIQKEFRGRRINHLILNELFYNLKKDGFRKIIALVYESNKSSINSLSNYGWKKVGIFYFLKIILLNFKISPPELKSILF